MPATPIRTVVDHESYMKGDVIIAKHQFHTPSGLQTLCSRCQKLFPTTFRRMAKWALEVRNVPQCPACRGRYHAKKSKAQRGLNLNLAVL